MTHLRQRMIEDMGIRNLAYNTQSAYLQQVIRSDPAQCTATGRLKTLFTIHSDP